MSQSQLKIVRSKKQLLQLIQHCKTTRYCAFDFETSSLAYYEKHEYPLCLGVSFQPGSAWVIPLAHKDSPFLKNNKWVKVLKLFGREVLENWDIVKIAWNFKFEYKWCLRYGITCKGRLFDAQLAKYCLDEERPNDLKSWVEKLFPDFAHYEDEINDGKPWAEKDFNKLAKYCGLDCDLTGRIMTYFERRLIDLGFYNLFRNLLMMGMRVLAESEYEGMIIDRPYLLNLMEEYKVKIEAAKHKLDNMPAVVKFNKKMKQRLISTWIKEVELEIAQIEKNNAPNAARLIANRELKIKKYLEGQFSTKEQEKLGGLNWNSPQQVIDFFYRPTTYIYTNPKGKSSQKAGQEFTVGTKFGLRMKPKIFTDTGAPSTSEEALEEIKDQDKTGVIDALLEYRGMEHLNKIYIKGMYEILGSDDRVHANFKIFGTVTGRLSCLSGDTNILTDRGVIPLKELCPKKKGWGIPKEDIKALTPEGDYQRILATMNQGRKELYEVELEDGRKIKATLDHQFLTNRGWLSLKEICDTDDSISKELVIYEAQNYKNTRKNKIRYLYH